MEFVFVVPRGDLFPAFYPHGLVPFSDDGERKETLSRFREKGYFMERGRAEQDLNFKQVIPYTMVMRDDSIFLLRRLSKGGEERLHGKLSIGVGGHINPEDRPTPEDDPIAAGTARELAEEMAIQNPGKLRAVGLLNDDSNAVGAVHVGLVQVLETSGEVHVREEDVLDGEFVTIAELKAMHTDGKEFETWSSILIERLDEILQTRVPALT